MKKMVRAKPPSALSVELIRFFLRLLATQFQRNSSSEWKDTGLGNRLSISLPILKPDHQLESRPNIVHGANFDVHHSVGQGDVTNDVLVQVCCDTG